MIIKNSVVWKIQYETNRKTNSSWQSFRSNENYANWFPSLKWKSNFFFRFFSNETCVRLAGMCSYLCGLAILNVLWVNDAYKMDLIEKLRQLWQQSRFGILFAAQLHRHRHPHDIHIFTIAKAQKLTCLIRAKTQSSSSLIICLFFEQAIHGTCSVDLIRKISTIVFHVNTDFHYPRRICVCACVCVSKQNNANLMEKFRHLYFFFPLFLFKTTLFSSFKLRFDIVIFPHCL